MRTIEQMEQDFFEVDLENIENKSYLINTVDYLFDSYYKLKENPSEYNRNKAINLILYYITAISFDKQDYNDLSCVLVDEIEQTGKILFHSRQQETNENLLTALQSVINLYWLLIKGGFFENSDSLLESFENLGF